MYQIYPRSYKDSNGDGIGDLPGIIEKLEYLEWLGVDSVWLSPFYPSPMADFGYDVSDYRDIDPMFGTMKDFRRLLKEAHARNINVIIDFVPNHTSDEHSWFKESRASRTNAKRDWYIWRDGKPDGSPPNNWLSMFGGSAWKFDTGTGQYYLHSFLEQQPDLDWDNPEVRAAMLDNMRFWLDLGVDGFRIDAVSMISKDKRLRDDLTNLDYHKGSNPYQKLEHIYSQQGHRLFEYLRDMAELLKSYNKKFMVIEAYPEEGASPKEAKEYYQRYYERVDPSVAAPFNFEGILADWDAEYYGEFISEFQKGMHQDFVPVYCFGNHDQSRLATRLGRPAARLSAMLQLTLPGMPTIYYGEEVGMVDGTILPNQTQDPFAADRPELGLNRDPERTPMVWSPEYHAGFTTGKPWLPINKDYKHCNVNVQSGNPDSFLELYRSLLHLRRSSLALKRGGFRLLKLKGGVLAYRRMYGDESYLVLLNFQDRTHVIESDSVHGEILLTSHDRHLIGQQTDGTVRLEPHQGLIIHETTRSRQ